jgi:hypothetical protein
MKLSANSPAFSFNSNPPQVPCNSDDEEVEEEINNVVPQNVLSFGNNGGHALGATAIRNSSNLLDETTCLLHRYETAVEIEVESEPLDVNTAYSPWPKERSSSPLTLHERMAVFYATHNPDKLVLGIDRLVARYENRETELSNDLRKQYGVGLEWVESKPVETGLALVTDIHECSEGEEEQCYRRGAKSTDRARQRYRIDLAAEVEEDECMGTGMGLGTDSDEYDSNCDGESRYAHRTTTVHEHDNCGSLPVNAQLRLAIEDERLDGIEQLLLKLNICMGKEIIKSESIHDKNGNSANDGQGFSCSRGDLNVDIQTTNGTSALYLAAQEGRLELMRM